MGELKLDISKINKTEKPSPKTLAQLIRDKYSKQILKITDSHEKLPPNVRNEIRKKLFKNFGDKKRIKIAEAFLSQASLSKRKLSPKQKTALLDGNELMIPNLLEEAHFSEKDIKILTQKHVIERRRALCEIKDGSTGFRNKAMILSSYGLSKINRKILGSKIFIFLDFDNMGPPNDYKLGGKVDQFIRYFAQLSREVFSDIPNEFLRLGSGDEFGIFLPNNPEAIAKYEEFFKQLEIKRKELFNSERLGENYDKTVEKATFVKGMSSLRKEYKTLCLKGNKKFTIDGYTEHLRKEGTTIPNNIISFSLDVQMGLLERNLAEKLIANGDFAKRTILTNTHAAVKIDGDLTPKNIENAMNTGVDEVHILKASQQESPDEILYLNDDNKKDSEIRYEQHKCEEQIKFFESLKNEYLTTKDKTRRKEIKKEIYHLQFIDPAIPELLKLNLVKNELCGKLLDISEESAFTCLTIDIISFGAINNNHENGYKLGDSIVQEISEIVSNEIIPEEIFRLGGGCLKMITQHPLTPEKINKIEIKINEFWQKQKKEFSPETFAEASGKQALKGESLTNKLKFNKLEVTSEKILINPKLKVFEIF